MKTIVFGSSGFIGSAVARNIENAGHEVYGGINIDDGSIIDLLDQDAVSSYIEQVKPDVIINCAGVVSPDDDFSDNGKITENILNAVHNTHTKLGKLIITGSAGEYGPVKELPVSETTALNATNPYGESKIKEEQKALELGKEFGLDVVVARIFNPLGSGMKERFLIPGLLKQINAIKEGTSDKIEISRLDAMRDYVSVDDIATAYRLLAENKTQYNVYNIGSGNATSNDEILNLLIKHSKLVNKPQVVESSPNPEVNVASQADITRIKNELGWAPNISIEQVVEGIINERK